MIKLRCCNPDCKFVYSVSEKEYQEYGKVYHSQCMICGAKLEVDKLMEMVKFEIYKRAEEYLNKWIAKLGLEGCMELLERHRNQACYRIYKELMEKRGLKLKGEPNETN